MHSIFSIKALIAYIHSGTFHFGISLALQPIIALVAGLIILIRPRFLNFVVALYLILIGVLGLFHLRG